MSLTGDYPKIRKAVLLDRTEHLIHAEIPMPEAADHEVVVQVRSVGICGSDLTYFHKGGSTIAKVAYPHLLGHELAGDVVFAGKEVSGVTAGDRVAVEPGYPCGECYYCKSGRYNLCKHVSFMSTPIYRPYSEGAFTEYVVRPDWGLHKIPDEMSYDEAAMIEPLAVGMQAVQNIGAERGMSALILGCGPIAMCILLSLKAVGVERIFMVDTIEERVKMAQDLGAEEGFLCLEEGQISHFVRNTDGLGVDLVFDTTDFAPLINQSIPAMKKGGKLLLLAVPHQDMISLNNLQIFVNQITVVTSFRYAYQFEKAVKLVGEGTIPLGRIITHRFPFGEAQKAVEQASEKNGRTCKVVLNW